VDRHRFCLEDNVMDYWKLLRIVFGLFFFALGFAGLFLPVLQGILFIIVGLLLIAPYNRTIRRWVGLFQTKHPYLYDRAHSMMSKFKRKKR
jgi:uncharacterized protein